MRTALVFFPLLFSVFVCRANDEKVTTKAELTNATVYISGAELQQNFKASVKKETQFIEVTNVSNSLEKNSLQIKSNNNITVLGFEFSNTYLYEEVKTANYVKIEDSITKVQKEINKLSNNESTLKDLQTVLNSNKDIKGTQTGMNIAELMKLMEYYKSKSLELKTEIADIDDKLVKLNETKEKLKNQLAEERKKNTQKGGRLIIQIACNIPGTYEFNISYLTPYASWIPIYDIKTTNINSPFDLIYKAKITQTTGIDWNQIRLKLSTALPNQSGNAPVLQTWFLQYMEPLFRLKGLTSALPKEEEQLQKKAWIGYGAKKDQLNDEIAAPPTVTEPLYVVNGNIISKTEFKNISPQAIKSMNVLKGNEAIAMYGSQAEAGAIIITLKDELPDYVTVKDNALNMVYNIDVPLDITTNGKEQVAVLQSKKVDAVYSFYAIPKLSDNVYLLARAANWNQLNLLDGEANLFFENTYIGKTGINAFSVQDTTDLTVATDKRIMIKREKLKDFSSTQFLSNYKKEIFTYEITVKNNKSQPAPIIIKDQYPVSSNKDIEVELTDNSNAQINSENGELKWQLVVQPNEQKKIRFQYSIKYPKDKKLNL